MIIYLSVIKIRCQVQGDINEDNDYNNTKRVNWDMQ